MGFKMISIKSVKYIYLLGILSWFALPVLDFFQVTDDNKYQTVVSVFSLLFFLGVFFSSAFMIFSDEDDARRFYAVVFEFKHYGWYLTLPFIPCIIYAFNYEYYSYMGMAMILFIILERMRTVQNKFAQEYEDMQTAEEIRRKSIPTTKVDL